MRSTFSNPPLGDFQQLSNTIAVSGRLDFTPTSLPGFGGSISAYYSPNTTPRGAHDDLGNFLGTSSLAMFDAEFRYRVPDTGLELRGEYVYVGFGNPANLRANNDSDPTDNVGKSMFGYSGEIAYHVPLGTILKQRLGGGAVLSTTPTKTSRPADLPEPMPIRRPARANASSTRRASRCSRRPKWC